MNYISRLFSGRIGSIQYLLGILLFSLVILLVSERQKFLPSNDSNDVFYLIEIGIFLINFLFLFSVFTRRLHDLGYSGWWSLLIFIPIAGAIQQIILLFRPGDKGNNKYGNPPPSKLEKKLQYLFAPIA